MQATYEFLGYKSKRSKNIFYYDTVYLSVSMKVFNNLLQSLTPAQQNAHPDQKEISKHSQQLLISNLFFIRLFQMNDNF